MAKKDWKEFLGKVDEKRINEILHGVEKHRKAYRSSKDIRMNQFVMALHEHKKYNDKILKRIELIEKLARQKKSAVVPPIVMEKQVPIRKATSYWQLPLGALPLMLSILILANISLAESASQLSFASSILIAFSMIAFAGIIWFSAFRE